MRTAPGDRTRRSRGQILPIGAMAIAVMVLLAGLILDGALAYQAQRDLEIVAEYAAKKGADEINAAGFYETCEYEKFWDEGLDCDSALLLSTSALTVAKETARDWLAQAESQMLGGSSTTPLGGGGGIVATSASGGRGVTVTITRCYRRFLVPDGLMGDATGCGGRGTRITASATADVVLGG